MNRNSNISSHKKTTSTTSLTMLLFVLTLITLVLYSNIASGADDYQHEGEFIFLMFI